MCNNPVEEVFRGKMKNIRIKRPCGNCLGCRIDKLSLWQARCNSEWVKSRSSFVTFTYDDLHLPYKDNFSFLPTVDNTAIHRYVDNLKHKIKRNPLIVPEGSTSNFSYYGCSEYGGKFGRPHYHVLFFGLDFYDCKKLFYSCWKNGYIKSLPILRGGIRYVCDYVSNQLTGDLAVKNFDDKGIDRPKQFSSRGLGFDFFFAHHDEIARTGNVTIGSRVVPVPTYYVNLFSNYTPEELYSRFSCQLDSYRKVLDKAKKMNFSYDSYIQYCCFANEKSLVSSFRKSGKPVIDIFSLSSSQYSSSILSRIARDALYLSEVS